MRTLIAAKVRKFALFSGIVLLVCAFSPLSAFAFSGTGLGTEARPFKVATCDDLQDINNDLDAYYVQTGNIDCSDTVNWNSGVGFLPIGEGSANFTGTYDGQNFSINDLVINEDGSEEVGLFRYPDGATIKNIHLVGGYFDSDASGYNGSIAARAYDTVFSDCSSTMEARSVAQAGLVGAFLGGTMTRCWYSGDIDSTGNAYTSGLVAVASDVVFTDIYTAGTLNGDTYSGSLIGSVDGGSVTNAYSSMDVTSVATVYSGGLFGILSRLSPSDPNGSITDTFFAGSFTETASNAGAITGVIGDTDFDGVFYDQDGCGCTPSIGNGSPNSGSVTAVNTDGSDPNYFKGDNANEPMASWDFDTVWQTNTGDFPTLRLGSTPVDSDGDGISNAVEDAGANSGDANGDGVADSSQANVVAGTNAVTSGSVSLSTDSECEVASFATETEADQSAIDTSYSYPLGLINFTLTCNSNGATATVTQYLADTDQDVSQLVARKITNNSYTTISDASIARQTIGDDSVIAVTYNITDGGTLDADGSPNGTIVDPVGVALSESVLAGTGQNQRLIAVTTIFALLLVSGAIYSGIATFKSEY